MKTQNFNSSLEQVIALLTTTKEIVTTAQKMSPNDNYKDILNKIAEAEKRAINQTFQIAVMAMIKSGKSTFINALLGQEFLPMSNVPETAVSVTVRHSNNPSHKNGVLLDAGGKIAEGKKIQTKIAELNDEKRDKNQVSNEQLILEAPLQYLVENNKPLDGIKFEILDTPGFGEAEIAILKSKHVTMVSEDILENVGLIIYLLDYTKLKGKEEEEILLKLKNFRPDLLERVQDRLFFVVNKIDLENRTGLTPEQTADYVWNLVKSHIPSVKKANILTLSAGNALLARLILSGEATTDAVTDFAKQVFGYTGKGKTLEECKEEADDFLADSNLPNIENEIINHIYKNRGGILIDTLISDLEKIVNTFLNAKIKTAIATLKNDRAKMLELLESIKKSKNDVSDIKKSKKKYIITKDFIRKSFEKYTEELTLDIKNLIKLEFKLITGSDSGSDIVELDVSSTPLILSKLHKKIHDQTQVSFSQHRPNIERYICSEVDELFSNFSSKIKESSDDFSKKLNKSLKIDVDTSSFEMPKLNINNIMTNLRNKIDHLVKKATKTITEQVAYRVDTASACAPAVWETRYRPVPKTIDTNTISKGQFEEEALQILEAMNKNAIELAYSHAEKAVTEKIDAAAEQFEQYADEYASTISLELASIEKGGTQYVESRLKQLEIIEMQINAIINTINKVKSFTENESKK